MSIELKDTERCFICKYKFKPGDVAWKVSPDFTPRDVFCCEVCVTRNYTKGIVNARTVSKPVKNTQRKQMHEMINYVATRAAAGAVVVCTPNVITISNARESEDWVRCYVNNYWFKNTTVLEWLPL